MAARILYQEAPRWVPFFFALRPHGGVIGVMSSFGATERKTCLKRLPSGTIIWEFPTLNWRINKLIPMWRIFNAGVTDDELRDRLKRTRQDERDAWAKFVDEHVAPYCRQPIEISEHYSTAYFTEQVDAARYRLLQPDDTAIRFETLEDHKGGLFFVGGYEQYLEYLCAD